jgi:beta-glucosidase-like glycosyl hydrolase
VDLPGRQGGGSIYLCLPDATLPREAGAMLGREARARGFNVLLGGGINLTRDSRNGRNFEYLSEDPWHSAVLAAETINGMQSEGVISTLKHYSLNCNETNRHWLDDHRPGRAPRVRLAGVPDRHRARSPGRL